MGHFTCATQSAIFVNSLAHEKDASKTQEEVSLIYRYRESTKPVVSSCSTGS